jgi:hypothetical protein
LVTKAELSQNMEDSLSAELPSYPTCITVPLLYKSKVASRVTPNRRWTPQPSFVLWKTDVLVRDSRVLSSLNATNLSPYTQCGQYWQNMTLRHLSLMVSACFRVLPQSRWGKTLTSHTWQLVFPQSIGGSCCQTPSLILNA